MLDAFVFVVLPCSKRGVLLALVLLERLWRSRGAPLFLPFLTAHKRKSNYVPNSSEGCRRKGWIWYGALRHPKGTVVARTAAGPPEASRRKRKSRSLAGPNKEQTRFNTNSSSLGLSPTAQLPSNGEKSSALIASLSPVNVSIILQPIHHESDQLIPFARVKHVGSREYRVRGIGRGKWHVRYDIFQPQPTASKHRYPRV